MSEIKGKKKIIRDISANTAQIVITQTFGLAIFYFTSKFLRKTDFGEFNWCLAVGSTIIALASLGLDLVFVKKVAIGKNILLISGLHFFHTIFVAVVLGFTALIFRQFIPGFTVSHPLFFLIFVNLALANIANSFKLCLNGLEEYRKLASLAMIANFLKFSIIIFLYLSNNFTIFSIIIAYGITSITEFVAGYFLLGNSLSARIKPVVKLMEYKYFIIESLPQLGVVLFDSALARIDWILLGVLASATVTAEYSFAYRIFELSKLPILIIAPVLLTRFSKLFAGEKAATTKYLDDINTFFKIEFFVVMIIPLMLLSCWTPLIDYLTDNKYGVVNEINYRLLGFCIPLACVINFLWTLAFVQGQLKIILYITIAVSTVNVLLNLVLIPVYSGLGASAAFLVSTALQIILYYKYTNQTHIKINVSGLGILFLSALFAFAAASFLPVHFIVKPFIAVIFYFLLVMATRQIDLKKLKHILRKTE